jgi:hypothetical protein
MSPSLANHATQWRVHDEMHLLDHNLISCILRLAPEPLPVRKGRKLKKVDWTKFHNKIETTLEGFPDPVHWSYRTIEDTTNAIHDAITEALDEQAPIVPFRPKRLNFTWWKPELDDLRKATRLAHKAARRSNG